ncbi:MAG: transposase [Myxococcota bacterium]
MSGLAEILNENARLRREMEALQAELSDARTALASRDAMLEALRRTAEHLAQQLELARLRRQGPSSERHVADGQGVLPFPTDFTPPPRSPVEDAPTDDEELEPAPKSKGRRTPRRRNREDFAHFSAVEVHCAAAEDATCPSCGGALESLGTASSFRIEWVPGHFVRHDVTRDKRACPKCPDQGVLTAPGPYALDRSMAGNGLVSRVLVDKFADHIPANRQAKRMKREGFEVGSHTLSSWIGKAGGLLARVAEAVRQQVLDSEAVQGDDTGMPVQDGGNGRLRKGRMWAFTDQEQVFYAFTETKAGAFPVSPSVPVSDARGGGGTNASEVPGGRSVTGVVEATMATSTARATRVGRGRPPPRRGRSPPRRPTHP